MNDRQIVFLHAFPCAGQMWGPQVATVQAAGWTAIAPDLPGFGTAPLPDANPDLDVVADEIARILAGEGDGPWTAVGVSLGGYVVMNLMRRYPHLVDRVVLCDTKATEDSAQTRSNRERLAQMCEEPDAEVARILEQAVLPGLVGVTTRGERPEVVALVRSWLATAKGSSVGWYQRAMANRPDSRSVLARFDGPALVLWGDEDTLSPTSEQEVMLAALRGAESAEIAQAGHLANVERPHAVSERILSFLDGTVPDRT